MDSPFYNKKITAILEQDAVKQFDVFGLKKKFPLVDRWANRKKDSPLCIINNEKYLDLCWWNGNTWVYITTNLKNKND